MMFKIGKNQKGITLIEMIVTVSIATLLMGAISMILVKVFFVNRFVFEQGLNNAELQNSIRNFSASVREARQSDAGGYMIELAEDFEFVFYSNIDDDSAVERVRYYLSAGQLIRGTAEASGMPPIYPEFDDEIKIVGNGIVNTSSQPIFHYYNQNYPMDMTNNPMVTPAEVNNISLIKLDIYANINPNHVPDTMRMETAVRPRNIK